MALMVTEQARHVAYQCTLARKTWETGRNHSPLKCPVSYPCHRTWVLSMSSAVVCSPASATQVLRSGRRDHSRMCYRKEKGDTRIFHSYPQYPTTDSYFPAPGLLGHRDGVRSPPGCVRDAQPGLALAANALGCPAAPLRCSVFCTYV